MAIYYVSNENGDWWTIETDNTEGQTLFIINEEDLAKVTDINDTHKLDRVIRKHGTAQDIEVA